MSLVACGGDMGSGQFVPQVEHFVKQLDLVGTVCLLGLLLR